MESRYYPGVEADVIKLMTELRCLFDEDYDVQTMQVSSTACCSRCRRSAPTGNTNSPKTRGRLSKITSRAKPAVTCRLCPDAVAPAAPPPARARLLFFVRRKFAQRSYLRLVQRGAEGS